MEKARRRRRRERMFTLVMGLILAALWMVFCFMMMDAWMNHPAEQPITYEQYMEQIGCDPIDG